jgi:hypothetical protein
MDGHQACHFRSLDNPPDASAMPYGQDPELPVKASGLGPGVFVAARTKINPANGTAADNKLYFQEMVAPTPICFSGSEVIPSSEQLKGGRVCPSDFRVSRFVIGSLHESESYSSCCSST